MFARDIINSTNLRLNFPEHYKELFSSCQVVVSTSDSFFWAGEYARFYGGMAILQKVPTKNLVGLEVLSENKILMNNALYGFDTVTNSFRKVHFDPAKESRLINFLEDYWQILDPKGKIKGFKIHLLSESHCGGGLGSTGVVLGCLATALMILAEKVKVEEVKNWQKAKVDDLLKKEEYASFRKTFRLAWRMTAASRGGNSSGVNSFAAMIASPYPILYFSKSKDKFMLQNKLDPVKFAANHYEAIEKIPFWGGKMEEVFSLDVPQPWPIDIGRVYSGNLVNTEHIFKMLSSLGRDVDSLQKLIEGELAPKAFAKNLTVHSLFDFEAQDRQTCSHQDYLDILNIISIKMMFALKDLFTIGPGEEGMRKFVECIHQAQDFGHFLGHSTPFLDRICQRFVSVVAQENDFNIAGAKIEGIGKGGHILFIGPAGTISNKVIKEAQNLAKSTGKDIFLDWASWIDGFGESGLEVEQSLPQGIYSSFVSPQSFRMVTYFDGQTETKILNVEEFDKAIKDSDLALITPDHKISIKGTYLSSKEIPSAKATIDIFKKVLASKTNKISNKAFINSSYGQSRYDLQSKIFIPLKKTLQRIAKKKLDFQISGGMYDNFTVSLNCQKIKITLIENI